MPTLYPHQQEFVDTAPNRFGCFYKMGVGKSAVALELAKKYNQKPLIICPKSLTKNWVRECKLWGVDSYEIITKEKFRSSWETLQKYNFLAIDEFHYFLGYKSQMHKSLLKYLKKYQPEYIYGLTGSPYLSTPYNVYAAELLLGHQPKYLDYRNKYFEQIKMGVRTVPIRVHELDHLLIEKINEIGITKTMEDVVDEVPKHVYIREDFETTKEQKIAIGLIPEAEPIAMYAKSFQIENGTKKSNGYDNNEYYKSEKFNRTLELIKDNKKLILICHHNLEIKRFTEEIKDKIVFVINGATRAEDRQHLIDFANDSENCVLIINASICEGFNLPGFDLMVFYSMSWSIKDREQMEGRVTRINALKRCTYIDMVVSGGVDEAVYDCIKDKKDFQAEIYHKK